MTKKALYFSLCQKDKFEFLVELAFTIEIIYNFVGAIDLPDSDENLQEAI